jgi:hypothetical protein
MWTYTFRNQLDCSYTGSVDEITTISNFLFLSKWKFWNLKSHLRHGLNLKNWVIWYNFKLPSFIPNPSTVLFPHNLIISLLLFKVSCIRDIKLPEIRKWYNDHVLCGNKSNFRKLSVQVSNFGCMPTYFTHHCRTPHPVRVFFVRLAVPDLLNTCMQYNLWGHRQSHQYFFNVIFITITIYDCYYCGYEIVIKITFEEILLWLTAPAKIVVIDATGCRPQK